MAEKLRLLLQRHRFPEFPDLRVTTSIGVGSYTCCERSFHHLFRRVDTALYRAKAQGRNQTVVARDIPAEED
jgi:diguanylate cyclase (GGDEF)-like protein